MTATVVIPARNAGAIIGRVLDTLLKQLEPGDTVVVVDDGSTDETSRRVAERFPAFAGTLRLLTEDARGAGSARNRGLAAASGDLVWFLGADCVPAPSCLARHRAVHRALPKEGTACLGNVTWDPKVRPTPFMVWLEHGGPQNCFGELAGAQWVSPRYASGANLSLKRSFALSVGGFADTFSSYGWEDAAFGLRLRRAGGRLFYEPAARVWHAHRRRLGEFLIVHREAGKNFVGFAESARAVVTFPAGGTPRGWFFRRIVYPPPVRFLARALAFWAEERWIIPALYARVTGWEFTDGVHSIHRSREGPVDKSAPVLRAYG